jgi:Flp pilus assembly protein TadG
MKAAIYTKWRQFLRAHDGVTAVEFAVIAPVIVLLLMGIVEFALIMLTYNVMESATSVSARLGATGFTASGTSRAQTILAAINNRAGALINTSQLAVTAKYYTLYDQINDPEPYTDSNHNSTHDSGEPYTDVNGNGSWDADMGTAGYGGAGDIVVYTVTYPWQIVTPLMSGLIGTNGTFTITTHAVTKNEPF